MRKYYSPALKAWVGDLGDGVHDGGPEDPRIAVIRVVARTATYALAVGTSLGRGIEIIKGAVTGQTAEVNKLRELTEKELDECKSPAFAPRWVANAFCSGSTCSINIPIRVFSIQGANYPHSQGVKSTPRQITTAKRTFITQRRAVAQYKTTKLA